jgi:hypothetical protein
MKKLFTILVMLVAMNAYSQMYPPPNGYVCPGNLLLNWDDVPSAVSYKVRVYLGAATIVDVSGLTQSQYLILSGVLSANTEYYWKIGAVGPGGTTVWSANYIFTTLPSAPVPPLLTLPVNGGNPIYPNNPIVFYWRHTATATSYRILISSPAPIINQIITDTLYIAPPGTFNYYTTYYWRVAAINACGEGPFTTVWSFVTLGSSGIINISSEIPTENKLYSNYPNPFNPVTKIKFDVGNGFPIKTFGNDKVVLKVYDVMGREVQTLVNESLKPGTYEAAFDARHGGSSSLNSGVYFYKLITGGFTETKKMLLLK